MKKFLKAIYELFLFFGFNILRLKSNILGLGFYFKDFKELKKQKGKDGSFRFGKLLPVLDERGSESGVMKGHYFHQDFYVAQRIFEHNPAKHVDVGSRIDGFVAHVAVFRPIEILDIRIQKSDIDNITYKQADLMKLPDGMIDYCDSISSLHAIEHFGLGRYGDPIDYYGHVKGIQNISRILKKNGRFYFSVPIGDQRIEFNGQRVFSVRYLLDILENDFILEYFSYVDDKGDFHKNITLNGDNINSNIGCNYGCGIFELIKK